LQAKSWNIIPSAYTFMKHNYCLLDKSISTKKGFEQFSHESQAMALLLLKTASVIGEVFTLRQVKEAIKQIVPHSHYFSQDKALTLLGRLENQDLIELIYEN